MEAQNNPYAAPTADAAAPAVAPVHYGLAPPGQRFANLSLDYIGFMFTSVFVGVAFVIVAPDFDIDSVPDQLFGIIIMILYYVVCETLTGRTLGKLVTGTKVVAADGGRLRLLRVLGRTLSRFIPFEAFTFISGNKPGLHDSLSGTIVVRLRPSKLEKALEHE